MKGSRRFYFALGNCPQGISSDEGISGTGTSKRKAFNLMIEQAEAGLFELIITKEISRFARNTLDSLKYTRMLKKWGVGVIFLNDNINTLDADSELRLTIMSCIAQEESRKTSDRVKWGQRRQMEKGVVFGGDTLGYKREKGGIVIDEKEAEIVRLIYKKYCEERKGLYTIAKELEDEGYRTKKGLKRWTNAAVSRILKNEKYIGDLKQRKTYTVDYLTHEKRNNAGEEEFIIQKEHHEAIIDRDTFDKARQELKKRNIKTMNKSKYTNRYIFSGKIKCAECGAFFVARKRKRKEGYILYWQCLTVCKYGKAHKNGQGEQVGCGSASTKDDILKKVFTDRMKQEEKSNEIIINKVEKAINIALKQSSKKTGGIPAETEIENITRKKYDIIDLYLEKRISKEDMQNMADEYDRQINIYKAKLTKIQNSFALKGNQPYTSEKIKDAIKNIVSGELFSEEVCKEILDYIVVCTKTDGNEKNRGFEVCLKGVHAIS